VLALSSLLEEYMELKKVKLCMCVGIHYISKGWRHEIFWPKSLRQVADTMTAI